MLVFAIEFTLSAKWDCWRKVVKPTYAALLALSVYAINDYTGSRKRNSHSQLYPHLSVAQQLTHKSRTNRKEKEWSIPEAVNIILPPLRALPLEGLVCIIACDPCFTARKHLKCSSIELRSLSNMVLTTVNSLAWPPWNHLLSHPAALWLRKFQPDEQRDSDKSTKIVI